MMDDVIVGPFINSDSIANCDLTNIASIVQCSISASHNFLQECKLVRVVLSCVTPSYSLGPPE